MTFETLDLTGSKLFHGQTDDMPPGRGPGVGIDRISCVKQARRANSVAQRLRDHFSWLLPFSGSTRSTSEHALQTVSQYVKVGNCSIAFGMAFGSYTRTAAPFKCIEAATFSAGESRTSSLLRLKARQVQPDACLRFTVQHGARYRHSILSTPHVDLVDFTEETDASAAPNSPLAH